MREQASGKPGVRAGQHEGDDLVAGRIDSRCRGGELVLTDRLERPARPRRLDAPGHVGAQRQRREHEVVVLPVGRQRERADRRRRDAGHPIAAVGHRRPVDEHQLRDNAEADRRQRQVMPGKAQARPSEPETDQPAEDRRHRHRGQHRPAPVHGHVSRRVGADPEECRLRQGQLAGKAEQNPEAQYGDRVDAGDVGDVEEIVRVHDQRNAQQHDQQHRQAEPPAPAHAFSPTRSPNSPCGRTTSTTIRITNAIASTYAVEM